MWRSDNTRCALIRCRMCRARSLGTLDLVPAGRLAVTRELEYGRFRRVALTRRIFVIDANVSTIFGNTNARIGANEGLFRAAHYSIRVSAASTWIRSWPGILPFRTHFSSFSRFSTEQSPGCTTAIHF